MELQYVPEPELEFAAGRHIDIRFGLANFGPLDRHEPSARHSIHLAVIGTPPTVEGVCAWLEQCRRPILGKRSKRPNLFPAFPGFEPDGPFASSLVMDHRLQRNVVPAELSSLLARPRSPELVEAAVSAFLDECRAAMSVSHPDVIVCAPPAELLDHLEGEDGMHVGRWRSRRRRPPSAIPDFHDILKARAMGLGVPVQMVRPETYDTAKLKRLRKDPSRNRALQDAATRAWNIHTALYYKAGGALWRLSRDASDYSTCYVGISFYDLGTEKALKASLAQVFNERGFGVVVRGGSVHIDKDDRQPHLDSKNAADLLRTALTTYRQEHKTLPARLVLHKTSRYTPDELEGFKSTATDLRIDSVDLLHIGPVDLKLFRVGEYPPLRGTVWSVNDEFHVIYTRGSIQFYSTYPGLYVPVPLGMRIAQSVQSPQFLAKEILGLSKMNWNSTQFDERDPITIRGARKVGHILKHLDDNDEPQPRYSFYM